MKAQKFLFILLLIIGLKLQAQQPPVSRIKLMTTYLPEKATILDVQEVTMEAGSKAPVHVHPCQVVGYVLAGEIVYHQQGNRQQYLREGDVFVEPANATILEFANASTAEKARFLVLYLKENATQPEVHFSQE